MRSILTAYQISSTNYLDRINITRSFQDHGYSVSGTSNLVRDEMHRRYVVRVDR